MLSLALAVAALAQTPPATTVQGRVLARRAIYCLPIACDEPVGEGIVQARSVPADPAGAVVAETPVQPDGSYSLPLAAGSYTISVTGVPPRFLCWPTRVTVGDSAVVRDILCTRRGAPYR